MSAKGILVAIDLSLSLLQRAAQISSMVRNAQAEGREDLLPEEWNVLQAQDDEAKARQLDSLARAKAEGR
jgi:hypothetical protein